jgi:hypothetical protein
MKTIISAMLLIATSNAVAQVKTLNCLQPFESIYSLVDSVAALLPSTYHYSGVDSGDAYKPRKTFTFTWSNPTGDNITLSILRTIEGSNHELGITGKPIIAGAKIIGPYLDIFPVWANRWNKQADLAAVQKDGQDIIGRVDVDKENYLWLSFRRMGNGWGIESKVFPPR